MTTENNTTLAPAATLTEKELWASFTPLRVRHTSSFGPTIEEYIPEELLRECGGWGELTDFTAGLADNLDDDDQPGESLDCLIQSVESYLDGLKIVQGDFERLKKSNLILPPEPKYDPADLEIFMAWEVAANAAEADPRFSPPVIVAVGVAA